MTFEQVVSTNVYLDDLSDVRAFDDVYVQYFNGVLPARTTIEQIAPGEPNPQRRPLSRLGTNVSESPCETLRTANRGHFRLGLVKP